jgi:uncharacterized protein (DUF362 family)/NAD-dependent dihydropyrimidine dehydrogenase PreA subunit
MKFTVWVVRCSSYDQIETKVTQLIEMMGGIKEFARPGDRVALKPNLLLADGPERAATTHPALAAAVGKLINTTGASSFLIDGPTGSLPHTRSTLERIYRETGMAAAARKNGPELCYDTRHQAVAFPDGKLTRQFQLLTPLLNADTIINLPKLKTHSLMILTGAVKNLFGAVPGRAKPGYHATLQNKSLIAQMLLDLAECVAPRLSIMDAVVGMEGNGPSNGIPRQIGLLLGSENPLALDVVASRIIGLNREDNPLLVAAEFQGRRPTHFKEVELVGIHPDDLRIPDFQLPDTLITDEDFNAAKWWQELLFPLGRTGLTLQPRVIKESCIACEDCVNICPMDVITIQGRKKNYAQIDDDGCIRCYCCHETCPEDAIELHKSLLYRLIRG